MNAQLELEANALDVLLERLDTNRTVAAARYEALRRRLVGFFGWRGALHPEDAADLTLDRLMRRLVEGEPIERVEAYAYGIARLVLFEATRADRLVVALPDDVAAPEHAQAAPGGDADDAADALGEEQRLQALDGCLAALPPAERELVLAYYAGGDGANRIEQRKRIAAREGAPEHIVRARVFRIRARLERCLRCRLGGERGDTITRHLDKDGNGKGDMT